MNEKQGDLLDQRIRQALSHLPDAPPPNSPFDSARLWEQLRPELAAPPVARKRVGGWWWAAAAVVGLVMGWFWWGQEDARESVPVHSRSAKRDLVSSKTAVAALARRRFVRTPTVQRSGAALGRQAKNAVTNRPDGPTEYQSVVQPTTPQPLIPESVSVLPDITTPTVATAPKRRFRVVHENELIAEDEAHRVRYAPEGRTERFVRIGTGSSAQPTVNEESPALMLPLNRKTTQ